MTCVLSCLAFAAHLKFTFQTVRVVHVFSLAYALRSTFSKKQNLGMIITRAAHSTKELSSAAARMSFRYRLAFLRVIQELELI